MDPYIGPLVVFWLAGTLFLCAGFLRTRLLTFNPLRATLEKAIGTGTVILTTCTVAEIGGFEWPRSMAIFFFGFGITALAVSLFMLWDIVPKKKEA